MEPINIFISYEREHAGSVAGLLKEKLQNLYGFKVFLAHDDMPPSVEWEDEIPKRIKTTDFFIPLLSEYFKTSDFTDQETGIACSCNKRIIPIMLDRTKPYGFIRKYHGLSMKPANTLTIEDLAFQNSYIIFRLSIEDKRYARYKERAVHAIINIFEKSRIFTKTITAINTLTKIDNLNTDELLKIVTAIKASPFYYKQVFTFPSLTSFLQNKYNIHIDI